MSFSNFLALVIIYAEWIWDDFGNELHLTFCTFISSLRYCLHFLAFLHFVSAQFFKRNIYLVWEQTSCPVVFEDSLGYQTVTVPFLSFLALTLGVLVNPDLLTFFLLNMFHTFVLNANLQFFSFFSLLHSTTLFCFFITLISSRNIFLKLLLETKS